MNKSRKMRWTEYVAQMGRREMHTNIGGKTRRKETTRKTKA
jgi:hypothetical protein